MEAWNLNTATECPVTNKRNRQLVRQWNHWAHICDTHNCEWGIFDEGNGDEFQVFSCWTIGDYAPLSGWQTITSTADLWIALGY